MSTCFSFLFYSLIALHCGHIPYLFTMLALMDFLVLSSLLLLQIEPQRVALLPKFRCVFAIMSLGRFLEVGCGSENGHISSSAPGIALAPLEVWAVWNLHQHCWRVPVLSHPHQKNMLSKCWIFTGLLGEKLCLNFNLHFFYYEEVGDRFMSFKGFCILFLWLSLSIASFATELVFFLFVLKGRSQDLLKQKFWGGTQQCLCFNQFSRRWSYTLMFENHRSKACSLLPF